MSKIKKVNGNRPSRFTAGEKTVNEKGKKKLILCCLLFYLLPSTIYRLTSSCLYASEHILISGFSASSEKSLKDEFLRLYNPFDKVMDISGWRVQTKSTMKDVWKTKVLIPEKTIIHPKRYFTIANIIEIYTGPEPDISRNFPYGLLPEEGSIRILDEDGFEVDKVGYGDRSLDFEKEPAVYTEGGIVRKNSNLDTDNNKQDFIPSKKPKIAKREIIKYTKINQISVAYNFEEIYNQGIMEYLSGDNEEALKIFEELVSMNPKHKKAQKAIQRLKPKSEEN